MTAQPDITWGEPAWEKMATSKSMNGVFLLSLIHCFGVLFSVLCSLMVWQTFTCYMEREILISWWAILLWSEVKWQESVGPAIAITWQIFSQGSDFFMQSRSWFFSVFHRHAEIQANRASPVSSPPQAIGALDPITYICSEFWLVHFVFCSCCDWSL